MTKSQKRKIIYGAAEMIANHKEKLSCLAIVNIYDDKGREYNIRMSIRKAYADFYGSDIPKLIACVERLIQQRDYRRELLGELTNEYFDSQILAILTGEEK